MTTETLETKQAVPLPQAPAAPSPPRDAGARQATATLAAMLLSPVRDVLALADGPITALAIAPRQEWLPERLLELGVSSVAATATPGEATGRFDLVFADATDEGLGPDRDLLAAARAQTAGACLVLTGDAGASAAAARASGFAKVSLIEPPADAERRYVLHERSLLVAWGEAE
jgi:hypothetical protein